MASHKKKSGELRKNVQSIALFILRVILKNQKDQGIPSLSKKFPSSSPLCPMPRGRPPKRQRNTSGLKNKGPNKRTRHQESPLADGEIDLDSDQDRSRGVQDPLPVPSSPGSSSQKKSLNIDGQAYFFRASFGVEDGTCYFISCHKYIDLLIFNWYCQWGWSKF